MGKRCESLKSIIRRGFLIERDGEVWLPKSVNKKDELPSILVKVNHCLFCGKKI